MMLNLEKMIAKLRHELPVPPAHVREQILFAVGKDPFRAKGRVFWRYAVGFAVLAIFGGAGTVVAAQKTLPGNALYPLKRVSEKAYVSVQPGRQARAAAQEMIINRRFGEADAIAAAGRDFDEIQALQIKLLNDAMAESEAWVDAQENAFTVAVERTR